VLYTVNQEPITLDFKEVTRDLMKNTPSHAPQEVVVAVCPLEDQMSAVVAPEATAVQGGR